VCDMTLAFRLLLKCYYRPQETSCQKFVQTTLLHCARDAA
jgi:hypothetical protein